MSQCLREGPAGFVCTRAKTHQGPHVAGTDGEFTHQTVRDVWIEYPLEPGSKTWIETLEQAREERDAVSTHL